MHPAWYPDWSADICVLVAAGPSASIRDLDVARGRAKVLVINESWRLAPWADALYAADGAWWARNEGLPGFPGLKITQDACAAARFAGLHWVRLQPVHRILVGPGTIGSGGNSGFQALNLAVQFGVRRIALVGFDMSLANGVHWHGRHGPGLNNPRANLTGQWRRRLDDAAPTLRAMGVEVLNCSPGSALTAYRRASLEEALAC